MVYITGRTDLIGQSLIAHSTRGFGLRGGGCEMKAYKRIKRGNGSEKSEIKGGLWG
jgi:hypothetical protein